MTILSSIRRSSKGSGKFIANDTHEIPSLPRIQSQKPFCLGTHTTRQLNHAGGIK